MQYIPKISNIFIPLFLATLIACSPVEKQQTKDGMIVIGDALERSVSITTKPHKIITMRAGALRMTLYMLLSEKIAYIERNDIKRVVPYMMAHPKLTQLPVIGVGNNYDPESIMNADADILISTYLSVAEANAIQHKTGMPVFCIDYGDLYQYKDNFYKSLQVLGSLFDKTSRADSLIQYIEQTLSEIQQRSLMQKKSDISAYIGGIAFNGVQGIQSTRAQYPPFIYLNLQNPIDNLPNSAASIGMGQRNIFIDKEQLLEWDPEYIFLDVSGQIIWEREWNETVLKSLHAKQFQKAYTLLPFNWHTINYENLLCNMWFIGKTIYPAAFEDVDLEEKCREIFYFFYHRDIYDTVISTYDPFKQL